MSKKYYPNWTPAQDTFLVETVLEQRDKNGRMRYAGWQEIAKQLSRTPSAVQTRFYALMKERQGENAVEITANKPVVLRNTPQRVLLGKIRYQFIPNNESPLPLKGEEQEYNIYAES